MATTYTVIVAGFVAVAFSLSTSNAQTTTPLPCEDQNVLESLSCTEALAVYGISTCIEAERYARDEFVQCVQHSFKLQTAR